LLPGFIICLRITRDTDNLRINFALSGTGIESHLIEEIKKKLCYFGNVIEKRGLLFGERTTSGRRERGRRGIERQCCQMDLPGVFMLCCQVRLQFSLEDFPPTRHRPIIVQYRVAPKKLHFFHIHYIYGTVQNKVKQILPLHGLLNTVIHVLTFISRSSTHISHSVITQVPFSYSIFSSVSSSVSILFTG